MTKKFTKIRKWAIEKGFQVEDVSDYDGQPCIKIWADDNRNGFVVEIRKSTRFRTARGQMKGQAAGMYLSVAEGSVQRNSIHLDTQNDIISHIEQTLSYQNQTK